MKKETLIIWNNTMKVKAEITKIMEKISNSFNLLSKQKENQIKHEK